MTRCKLFNWFHLNSSGFNLNSPGFNVNRPRFKSHQSWVQSQPVLGSISKVLGSITTVLGSITTVLGSFPTFLGFHPDILQHSYIGGNEGLKVLNKYRKTSQSGCKYKYKFVLPVVGSLRSDSALNSLDFWDYSVELDCLQGPEGSHNLLILIIQ
jgi:hypothetical protein